MNVSWIPKKDSSGSLAACQLPKVDPIVIMLPGMGDYASDGEEDGSSSVMGAVGGGIVVNAAPAVEVFAEETKPLGDDARLVEYNPTAEAMWAAQEVRPCSARRRSDTPWLEIARC
jgi:hypothetical protein